MSSEEKIFAKLEMMERKIDRLNHMVQNQPQTHTKDLGDWLDKEQTFELLGLRETSLWSLRKRKKLEFRKVGNRTFYSYKSILDFIEKSKVK